MSETIDAVVVGAGVIGLAIARALARAGREVVILEATGGIGNGTSSRNSEVIHAGIYYSADSLKARLCVQGKELLYNFCRSHKVEHRRCGKLIVATDSRQLSELETIRMRAERNGVDDLLFLSRTDVAALEPALAARGALLSPSTGIIDSHGLMLALRGDAEEAGAMLAFHSPIRAVNVESGGFRCGIGGDVPMELTSALLVNAAGLDASRVARMVDALDQKLVPETYYAKGSYFALSGVRAPFHHLVYPIPEDHGLGVHLTLDLAGQARFGPDVEWVDTLSYDVALGRAASFYAAIRRYWPELPDGALAPAYAGIRPKIMPADGSSPDFIVQDEETHGIPGLVNLFGIESPGLTASLALAELVAKRLA